MPLNALRHGNGLSVGNNGARQSYASVCLSVYRFPIPGTVRLETRDSEDPSDPHTNTQEAYKII